MKTDIVKNNNEACALIRLGCDESATMHLHNSLLTLFRSHRHQPQSLTSPFSHQLCSHTCSVNSNDQRMPYFPEHDYDEGMTVFSQPLQICDECFGDTYGNASTEATIFFNLGIAHSRMGDDEEALVYLEKSLKLQVATVSEFGEERTRIINGPTLHVILHNIGHLHWKNARYTEAINSYSQALDNSSCNQSELQGQLDLSSTLNCIAVSMFYAGDPDTDDILTIFERALAMRLGAIPSSKADREAATIINNCGRVRFIRGEFDAAYNIYQEAYNQRVAVLGKDHIDVAASMFNMAQAKEHQGHIPEAINLYEQFVGFGLVQKGNGNIDAMIRALMTLGQLSYDHGDLERALDSFSRVLDFVKVTRTPRCEIVAKIFNKIGRILFDQSKLNLALAAFKSGLAIERDAHHEPHHAHVAMTLMDIARIKHYQNDFDECLKFYTEALEIMRHLNDKEKVAKMLIDLGLVHMERGDVENATRTLEEAVALVREVHMCRKGTSLLPCALNVLGLLRHKKGSFTLALSSFLEAIKVYRTFEKTPPVLDIAAVYQNAATVYREIGESDKALHYFQFSLRLGKIHDNGPHINYENNASLNYEIGMIFKEREDLDKALFCLNKALKICMESKNVRQQVLDISSLAANILSGLAELYLQTGDMQLAMQSFTDATELRRASGMVDGSWNLIESVGDFVYCSLLHQTLRKTNSSAAAAA